MNRKFVLYVESASPFPDTLIEELESLSPTHLINITTSVVGRASMYSALNIRQKTKTKNFSGEYYGAIGMASLPSFALLDLVRATMSSSLYKEHGKG
jgi:hypothetical protein